MFYKILLPACVTNCLGEPFLVRIRAHQRTGTIGQPVLLPVLCSLINNKTISNKEYISRSFLKKRTPTISVTKLNKLRISKVIYLYVFFLRILHTKFPFSMTLIVKLLCSRSKFDITCSTGTLQNNSYRLEDYLIQLVSLD